MSLNICIYCGFEKRRCQCIIMEPLLITEENMIRKIFRKIKEIILWPVKKARDWWHTWG